MPKISVIIPVYNAEKYLKECLDSVINQTLKDIEIICINDGSNDNSLQILNKYAIKDSRIKVISRKNKGVAKARNIGIKKASGTFVCFMDSDDIYPAVDVLETLYNTAVKNNVKICGGEFSLFANEDKTLKQDFNPPFEGYIFSKDELINYKDYQFDYGYHRFLYNRKFLIKNGIFFPNYKRFQDPPFFVNAMLESESFYGMHKITYGYRIGHNHIDWSYDKINGLLKGILDNFKYAKNYNLQKLQHYTYCRFLQHYGFINEKLGVFHKLKICAMALYCPKLKPFIKKENLNLPLNLIRIVFSLKNDMRKTHKIITILGLKIKWRRNGYDSKS